MISTTKFWFLLLDSATGQPYKGTTADFALLPPGAVVAEFRDAILSKNSAILTGIAPSQLLVYKNKAAFDNRSATKNEGNVPDPLDPTQSVDGLGSMHDMLIVVVPSSTLLLLSSSALRINQPSSSPPHQVQFFKSICNATEIDGGLWISFGENIMPDTSLNSLYIRECYRMIASSILKGNGSHKAIITGTPGIGKSLFLIYFLWNLVKEGKRVLFIYGAFNIYYDGKGGVFWFASGNLPLGNDVSFWNHSLWCLFDAKSKQKADLDHLPLGLSTFIVSTSPRRDMVNDFRKSPRSQTFYMPIWTETELEVIAPLFPDSNNEWHERFVILGGIPRYVLEDTKDSPTAILEAACSECSLDFCITKIGIDSEITEKSKVIHSLVHMISDPSFTKSSVCYASQTALNIIVQHKEHTARLSMRNLLASCEGNPLTAALCGYIFEPYAIELFEVGGTFTCRRLVYGNTNNQPNETLYIPPSKKIVVDRVLPNQTINQLYVPRAKKYTAIDAWIPGIGAFQMTVGKKHGINNRALDDLAAIGGGNRLYWVLHPLHFKSFIGKSALGIEQYAINIPYPE